MTIESKVVQYGVSRLSGRMKTIIIGTSGSNRFRKRMDWKKPNEDGYDSTAGSASEHCSPNAKANVARESWCQMREERELILEDTHCEAGVGSRYEMLLGGCHASQCRAGTWSVLPWDRVVPYSDSSTTNPQTILKEPGSS